MSDKTLLFPNFIGTFRLDAVFSFLLISYFWLESKVIIGFKSIIILFSLELIVVIFPVDIPILDSLYKSSNSSPIFKLDLSIGLERV